VTPCFLVVEYRCSGDICCLRQRFLSIKPKRSLTLKLEAIFTSETSLLIDKTTRYHNSEGSNVNNHRAENH